MQTPELDEAPKPIIRDADLAVPIFPFALVDRFRVPVLGIAQRLVHVIFSAPMIVELVVRQVVERAEGRRPRRRAMRCFSSALNARWLKARGSR